jgi:hypothetical protein
MECGRVVEFLADYSVDALDRRSRVLVAAHLESCVNCRAELLALDHAMSLVEVHLAIAPPQDLWDGIVHRIRTGEDFPERFSLWVWLRGGPNGRGLAFAGAGLAAATACMALLLWQSRVPEAPLQSDSSVSAMVRQHAMTAAESPFGDRAAWELLAAPRARADGSSL